MKSHKQILIALAGNPNSGKTTVFNQLTGARQHVANYPGVTVEKKEGVCTHNTETLNIVDLPGIYSLSARSPEEIIAKNYILDEKPAVVVNIVDASNLERNLFLTTQLLELDIKIVLVFNMSDIAEAQGVSFDLLLLSQLLGVPIVPVVGTTGKGIQPLLDTILTTAASAQTRPAHRFQEQSNDDDVSIAERRYGFISGACQAAVRSTVESRHKVSDLIDTVLLNRVLGLPIFFGLMYLVFHLTFTLGGPPMAWLESFFGWLAEIVTKFWPTGSASPLLSLLVDGIIGGVGGVLVFIPNILLLFLAIAILEDSGYMARAAFLMDRIMHKIGLHGKSFIPMLTGFGCSVPAIMATRTLEHEHDRLTTIMVTPLMSCGARLPIYALIIPAFFPVMWQGSMLWLIYLIGIVLAITTAKLLRSFLFKGDDTPFVLELPPYRLPTLKSVLIRMMERAWLYLKKAGTLILVISVVMWALTTYPQKDGLQGDQALAYSFAGRIGQGIEPVLRPMGFDWKIGTALIGAFAAKEVFVAQMGVVYAVENADETSESLHAQLRKNYSPLVAFCIMLFALISAPCMATIAVTRRETNSWTWALLQLGGLTILAYGITVLVFQSGRFLGIGL